MDKILTNLSGQANRKAQFKTVIALNLNGKQQLFTGVVKGNITSEKIGTYGFGYDPIFQPDDFSETFAEMTLEQKGQISHRGLATKQLIELLQSITA
jgi:XTP/dITP diphosphohydrolase